MPFTIPKNCYNELACNEALVDDLLFRHQGGPVANPYWLGRDLCMLSHCALGSAFAGLSGLGTNSRKGRGGMEFRAFACCYELGIAFICMVWIRA